MQAKISKVRVLTLAVLLLAFVPAAYLAWKFRDMPQFGRYSDDGIYFVSAKSLAQGSGYRILSLPGEPHQTKYPPLYPLYLSIAWRLSPEFPANLPIVMALSWVLLPVFVALAWLTFRDLGYGWTPACLLAAGLAVNPYSALFATNALSELLACCLLLGALIAANHGRAATAGVLAGVAFLTKSAFIVLLVAVPAWFLLKRRRHEAALSFGAMLPFVAGWSWWSHAHRAAPTVLTLFYTDYLGFWKENVSWPGLPGLLANNLEVMLGGTAALVLFGIEYSNVPMLLVRMIPIAAVAGTVRQGRCNGVTPYHLFALAYLPVLIGWNYGPHQRFLYPLWPLLLAGFATEIVYIAGILNRAWQGSPAGQRPLAAAGLVLLVAFTGLAAWRAHSGFRDVQNTLLRDRAFRPKLQAAYSWLDKHLPAGVSVLASDDPSLYLYTGRSACGLHVPTRMLHDSNSDPAHEYFGAMAEHARREGYDYILLTDGDFSQDLSRKDQARARARIDRDALTETVFAAAHITIRRVTTPLPSQAYSTRPR